MSVHKIAGNDMIEQRGWLVRQPSFDDEETQS